MTQTLGILGGMGPVATTAFMARVQALTPAKRDEDHIRMLVDLNPHVPNRHTAPEAAGKTLGEMAARLREAGAEVLAMPCNTAHSHAGAIRAAGLPFIDMIAATVEAVAKTGVTRVGVLATPGGEALYAEALARAGLEMVRLEGADREAFMTAVFAVKGGDDGAGPRGEMRRLAETLVQAGAGAVIAGCTEVPLLLRAEEVSAPLVDSAEVLAAVCVEMCR
ncbi:aspartate/glutamate racemase family protein [Brevundimonas sp. FT23028]|uniref:aspartate/glutamate racemase family protein n=1 Tax=Brevundimonas sp. FT23028 TaxID=3393748 RepID=UPI003B58856A